MPFAIARPLLQSISAFSGVQIRPIADLPTDVQRVALASIGQVQQKPIAFSYEDKLYIGDRYDQDPASVVVAGPFVVNPPVDTRCPAISEETRAKLMESMEAAGVALKQISENQRERIEVASQFELMGSAIIAITGELALETVLNRIVDLAREVAGAKYAALGVPSPSGELEKFITSGLTHEEHAAIGDLPRGRGLLGALIREQRSLRIRNIQDHPASVGFPPNHPPMHSFLGVPIIARGNVLGNLYLTEKRFASEFTAEDERLVELLARHAAVAIENAKLYAQLEEQEERLRFIIDQLPEAVILVEADPERVTLANRQASLLLGWDLQTPMDLSEFLAENPRYDTDGARIREQEIPVVRSLRLGETVIRSELQVLRPDGERLTLLANSAPLRRGDGSIIAAALVFQDITRIKDAEQLKDDFLSLVSHELRTPLTTIHGGAHLLHQSGLELEEQTRSEILEDIYTESRRLASLVENMVQLANIRAGRFQFNSEPVHVSMLIRRAIRGLGDSANNREITVQGETQLLADGDSDSLDQVLRNLLQNAIKYVPDDTPIVVESSAQDDQVMIAVRDFGRGVDPSDLPTLFDRFQRGRDRDTTAGMGLGLYLSRMIIEAHGGHLWVELPEDGGSRFVFSIPMSAE